MPRPDPRDAPAARAAEPHLVRALAAALDGGRVTVPLAVLRAAAVEADSSVAHHDQRARLWAAIRALREAGSVTLPGGEHLWDRGVLPRLPHWVKAVRERVPAPTLTWPDLALPADSLALLAGLRPTPAEIAVLTAVSRWLEAGGSRHTVPARERALELFGDEKALDQPGRLFARGVLTFELLRAEVVPLELIATWVPGRAAGEPLCVVAENHHTWVSLLRAARAAGGAHAGVHVGFGSGSRFKAGVRSLSALRPAVRAVSYFGDLDANGLEIPTAAAATAERAGLPPVVPAAGLYRRLFATPHRLPATAVGAATAAERAAWLGPALAGPAAELLAEGLRIPQEAVGTEQLAGSSPASWV